MNNEPRHDDGGETLVLARARRRASVDTAEFIAHQDAMYDRLQRIAEVERQICALQAAQLEEIAGYVEDRLSYDERTGCLSGPGQHRGMVAEVAIARHVSVITAEALMADAYLLTTQNPNTPGPSRRQARAARGSCDRHRDGTARHAGAGSHR